MLSRDDGNSIYVSTPNDASRRCQVERMSLGQTETSDAREEGEPILEVRNASVHFDMNRGRAHVLDDVSLDIYREEILGVVGESGCGKSMFAAALMDAVRDPGQLSGEIIYHPQEGEPFDILSLSQGELKEFRWSEISMVFQGAMNSFNPTMKVGDHFVETIRAHSEPREERMDHARRLLDDLYLDPDRIFESYPHELSGGMKQRALIALSLLLEPDILVMDEPTAALDLLMQRSIINMLTQLKKEYNLTIVFITHDMPLVAGLVDRLAVMYAFEIVELGPYTLISDASHPYTRGLLRSVPSLDANIDEMAIVEGSSPDPVNIPSGCSYHPRCPLADDRCQIEDPELVEIEEGHQAACFYWDQASDAVPYTLEAETWEVPE